MLPISTFTRYTLLSGLILSLPSTYALDATPLPKSVEVTTDSKTGLAHFIRHTEGRAFDSANHLAKATKPSANYLKKYAPLFGISNPIKSLKLHKESQDINGNTVKRYQQTFNNIPVIGAELIVNVNKDKQLTSINGKALSNPIANLKPSITSQHAETLALRATGKWHQLVTTDLLMASKAVLSIYDPKLLKDDLSPARLVWKVEVKSKRLQPIRELVLIDAKTSGILLHFNQIDFVKDRHTYTANGNKGESSLPGTLLCSEQNPPCAVATDDKDAIAAHEYAGDTYDYFFTRFGQDGIDDHGLTIVSTVHFDKNYRNAYWNGKQVIYGEGLAQADDTVGHELSHGYIEHSANLYYFDQSGAINESLADMWGEFIDLTNNKGNDLARSRWLHGEDDLGIGIIRSSKNPTLYGQPDKISSSYYYTGNGDNNGVHINSGVNNKAVYLMSDGETFNGQTVTGIGIEKVAKIYYAAQTKYLGAASTFADLYVALNQSCHTLAASGDTNEDDCIQVKKALDAVEMNQEPAGNVRPQAALCPTDKKASTMLYNTSFEGTVNDWQAKQLSGDSNLCKPSTKTPKTGQQAIFCENVSAESNTSWEMKDAVTLSDNNFLHFSHSFLIEPGFDAGKVEYSKDNGVSWNSLEPFHDAGKKETHVEELGSGFSGHSLGYVSSRYKLDSLKGEAVRFRFRVESDTSISGTGWTIDDFKLVQCSTSSDTPDEFVFSNQQNIALSTVIISNTVTISGLAKPVVISMTGDHAEYSINGGEFKSTSDTINNNDTVQVRLPSADDYTTDTELKLTIGTRTETFTITTLADPNALSRNPGGGTANTNSTALASNSNGAGGNLDWLSLILLSFLVAGRRLRSSE